MHTSTRILVVDDFAPFRHFVASLIKQQSNLQIIGEASDGLEAVQKALELQPDVVLLDIGLPHLNGIEAASHLLTVSPNSKIVFISQEHSLEIVHAAFSNGASGYVFKMDTEMELLSAVNAVQQGETFVGSRFVGHNLMATSASQHQEIVHRHEVGFYSDDCLLLEHAAHFVEVALQAGSAVITVVTESHRDGLLEKLRAHGADVDEAVEQGRYVSMDAVHAISLFVCNGSLEPRRFAELFGSAIVTATRAAKRSPPRVAVFGECVSLLHGQGKIDIAVEIERLCNQMLHTYALDILCAYSLGHIPGGIGPDVFQEICGEHSAVVSQ